ncbi:CPBP family intramembrane metalloprotease [Pyxidicoccus parkwayensis]|uniref:CPBP family intramembrane metalloprotease n=1 Tax=Pyxidicoccus parkwayensis TaxID=2813578 RepID=A0ABX7P629_9BACT|nr:CPBP family intramembrane glutamic endopeptidase [Pyxidicoccus parkwaysis]QSQ25907.1 CPBP family intramembrane metalloprotease [Pyxidicoccus parkwaysis]
MTGSLHDLGGLSTLFSGMALGFPLGVLMYLLSLGALGFFRKPQALRPSLCWRDGSKLVRYLLRSIYEELFWRGALHTLLGDSLLAVVLVAVLFTLRHYFIYRRRPPLANFLEFLAFSLLLGGVYCVTGNLWAAIAMHFVRNGVSLALSDRSTPDDSKSAAGPVSPAG